LHRSFNAIRHELNELRSRTARFQEEREFLEFQLAEISALDPKPNEDVEIEQELQKLEHAEELQQSASEIYETLYDKEQSVYDELSSIKSTIETMMRADSALAQEFQEITSALAVVAELSRAF